MRVQAPLALAVLLLALSPAASAAQGSLQLVPDWPDSFGEARREPIRLLPGPPLAEEATHTAAEPGSRNAGTSHTFHWQLQNPDGSPGPAGPLPLADGEPVLVDVYLSAGPPQQGPGPDLADAEAGLAPLLSVEAALTIAGETHEPQEATHTVVNTPGDGDVQRYRFAFDVAAERLEAGEGLDVDLSVHQLEPRDETLTQPSWRIHTGANHPSGVQIPLDPAPDGGGTALELQQVGDPSQQSIRQGAYAALAASALAIAWAARRGYRELRGD